MRVSIPVNSRVKSSYTRLTPCVMLTFNIVCTGLTLPVRVIRYGETSYGKLSQVYTRSLIIIVTYILRYTFPK